MLSHDSVVVFVTTSPRLAINVRKNIAPAKDSGYWKMRPDIPWTVWWLLSGHLARTYVHLSNELFCTVKRLSILQRAALKTGFVLEPLPPLIAISSERQTTSDCLL